LSMKIAQDVHVTSCLCLWVKGSLASDAATITAIAVGTGAGTVTGTDLTLKRFHVCVGHVWDVYLSEQPHDVMLNMFVGGYVI
jgi:hypothetical protein